MTRAENEIKHSKEAAEGTWGWAAEWGFGTIAGKKRALRRAEMILAGAEVRPGQKVLEIGCGQGTFTKLFAESGAIITALDLSPDLLTIAQNRLNKTNVQFVLKNFEQLEQQNHYQAIIGSSILHHLEIEKALPKMYSLLEPGGRISFAEPNMLNPQIFAERHFRQYFPHISPDETVFIRGQIRKKLLQAQFNAPAITPFDWLHPAIPAPLIGPVNAFGLFLENFPMMREFAGSLLIRAQK